MLGSMKRISIVLGALLLLGVLWLVYASFARPDDLQEKAAEQAAEDVAKAENPFDTKNPLADVETDPLGKTKAVLNPFE